MILILASCAMFVVAQAISGSWVAFPSYKAHYKLTFNGRVIGYIDELWSHDENFGCSDLSTVRLWHQSNSGVPFVFLSETDPKTKTVSMSYLSRHDRPEYYNTLASAAKLMTIDDTWSERTNETIDGTPATCFTSPEQPVKEACFRRERDALPLRYSAEVSGAQVSWLIYQYTPMRPASEDFGVFPDRIADISNFIPQRLTIDALAKSKLNLAFWHYPEYKIQLHADYDVGVMTVGLRSSLLTAYGDSSKAFEFDRARQTCRVTSNTLRRFFLDSSAMYFDLGKAFNDEGKLVRHYLSAYAYPQFNTPLQSYIHVRPLVELPLDGDFPHRIKLINGAARVEDTIWFQPGAGEVSLSRLLFADQNPCFEQHKAITLHLVIVGLTLDSGMRKDELAMAVVEEAKSKLRKMQVAVQFSDFSFGTMVSRSDSTSVEMFVLQERQSMLQIAELLPPNLNSIRVQSKFYEVVTQFVSQGSAEQSKQLFKLGFLAAEDQGKFDRMEEIKNPAIGSAFDCGQAALSLRSPHVIGFRFQATSGRCYVGLNEYIAKPGPRDYKFALYLKKPLQLFDDRGVQQLSSAQLEDIKTMSMLRLVESVENCASACQLQFACHSFYYCAREKMCFASSRHKLESAPKLANSAANTDGCLAFQLRLDTAYETPHVLVSFDQGMRRKLLEISDYSEARAKCLDRSFAHATSCIGIISCTEWNNKGRFSLLIEDMAELAEVYKTPASPQLEYTCQVEMLRNSPAKGTWSPRDRTKVIRTYNTAAIVAACMCMLIIPGVIVFAILQVTQK